MKSSRLAGVMAMVAALAGPAAMAECMDEAMSPPKPKPFSAERLQWETAKGAGLERPLKVVAPMRKEGDTLEVIVTRRGAPRNAGASFGTFGGQECLAWIGTARRMVPHENGLPPTEEDVKVVYVKPFRGLAKGKREIDRLAKNSLGGKGNAFRGTLSGFLRWEEDDERLDEFERRYSGWSDPDREDFHSDG